MNLHNYISGIKLQSIGENHLIGTISFNAIYINSSGIYRKICQSSLPEKKIISLDYYLIYAHVSFTLKQASALLHKKICTSYNHYQFDQVNDMIRFSIRRKYVKS